MSIIRLFTNPVFRLGEAPGYAEGFLCVCAFAIAVMIALVFHEVAHGYVAYLWGDGTAKAHGRLTLNPAKHLDIMGTLALLLFGFGWAKPVPVNPYNYRKRIAEIQVALAGVAVNLILAFIFSFFFAALDKAYESSAMTIITTPGLYHVFYFAFTLSYLSIFLNLFFMLFNLLPLFPLDGFRVLEYFFRRENAFMSFMRKNSLYILLAIFALSSLSDTLGIPNIVDYYIGGVSSYIVGAFFKLWGAVFGINLFEVG